ncbi:alanyl-tRNA synthetase, partial [Caulochytrium protostelioides]
MGFERVVSILQDKRSNYDTDVFTPILDEIQRMTGARPYAGRVGDDDVDGIDTAYRVVADHVRTLTFAITDGAVPDNEGAGYTVRRILRRGSRYIRKKFDVPTGNFFSRLSRVLVEQMGDVYPEIRQRPQDLVEMLDEEERSFARTLDRGERLFTSVTQKMKAEGKTE